MRFPRRTAPYGLARRTDYTVSLLLSRSSIGPSAKGWPILPGRSRGAAAGFTQGWIEGELSFWTTTAYTGTRWLILTGAVRCPVCWAWETEPFSRAFAMRESCCWG